MKKLITVLLIPFHTIRAIFRSKYIELILAVALFVLLDTGVLILNFYTSYQIANDAHAIQLASRMGTMTQKIYQGLYKIRDDITIPDVDYNVAVDDLAATFKVFDETLDAFIYGGDLIGVGQGKDALLHDTVYRDTSANLLTDAETLWKAYRVKLKPIVYSYFDDLEPEEILAATNEAITYARANSDRLLELMQGFSIAVEGVAQRKAERLRMIQSIGITLAVINFFLILFHFLRRLRRSDMLVDKARKETENILKNVNEGLFLLDREFTIGSEHSDSLHNLFQLNDIGGRNFIDLLRQLVSEKTLASVEEYTDILFSPRVNETLIKDLNPLDQVEINLTTDETAVFDIRYFSFQFSRVYEKKGFDTLLVTVKDITEQVRLAEQLKEAREKSTREIDMLLSIIHVDGDMLTHFLQTTGDGLNDVNVILKKPARLNERLSTKLEPISRIIHKLKGDSTAIGLDFLVEKFHRFEGEIAKLREVPDLSGEDFLPLVVALKQLISDFFVIGNLQEKMGAIDLTGTKGAEGQPSIAADYDGVDSGAWTKQLVTLVEKVARDYNKEVKLDISRLDTALLTQGQAAHVKDIVVQSLRNGVAHGIETPDVRENAGKPRKGTLTVSLEKNGGGLQLSIRDDGQGISLEEIKETALRKGLLSPEKLETMQRSNLLSLLFRQGFSTVKNGGGIHAGQGVGMNLVKSSVDSLGGHIKLKYHAGEYTEFQYVFAEQVAALN